MRRIKNVVGLVFTLIIIIFGVVFETENVFGDAGSNAPTSPSTCSLYGQCYGLGWEKYGKNEVPRGTSKLKNGDIYVYGTDQGAGSGTIRTSNCKSSYWRLAWYVAHDATASNGFFYKHNDQIGLMSLSDAHNEYDYNINSIPGATAAKNDWDKLSSNERRGYSWDSSSGLSWFCAESADVTLTAYAVIGHNNDYTEYNYLKTNGTPSGLVSSPPSDAYKVSSTVSYGSSASVTMDSTKGYYKWKQWGGSCGNNGETVDNTNRKCSKSSLTGDKRVYAYYKLVDPLPCEGGYTSAVCDSAIDINQSKNEDSGYTKDALYMKPGDMVYLKGSFSSDYQDKKGLKPQRIKLSSNDNKYLNTPGWSNNNFTGVYTIQTYFNSYVNPSWRNAGSWKNAFSIMSNGESLKDVSGTVGSNSKYGDSNNSDVGTYIAKLGTSRSAQSKTNQTDNTKNTPERIIFSYDGSYNLQANIDIDPKESQSVTTYTPYNFIQSIDMSVAVDDENTSEDHSGQDGVLVAGEDKTFKFNIARKPRENRVIGETYSTDVPYRKWTIRFTYNDVPYENNLDSDTLRDLVGNIYEEADRTQSYLTGVDYESVLDKADTKITVNIPDLPAGTKICAQAGVWPANSGFDTNWDEDWKNPKHNYDWAWSPKRCFVIAKKPNFQVWGSGVYSAGKINVPISKKGHVANINNYSPIPMSGYWDGSYIVFGSWTELSLVANGKVEGLASGAGTGYGTTTDVANPAISPNSLGGSAEGTNPSYCLRSTLSFANNNCNSNVGNLSSVQSNTSSDKSFLISRFSSTDSNEYTLIDFGSEDINISNERIGSTDNFSGDIEGEITKTTKVIRTNGNVTIDKNITYNNDNAYTSLEQIPKIIIYANNININCNVTRIDAVLIANDNINTCANIADVNAGGRSNQLIINGVTISNTLTLGRTYGAATGINSIIPAEIINYDSSLFLWANKQSSTTSTGKLTEAYTSELAPRY